MSPAEPQPKAEFPPARRLASTSRPVDNTLKVNGPQSAPKSTQLTGNERAESAARQQAESLGNAPNAAKVGREQAGSTAGSEPSVGSEQTAATVGCEQVESRAAMQQRSGIQQAELRASNVHGVATAGNARTAANVGSEQAGSTERSKQTAPNAGGERTDSAARHEQAGSKVAVVAGGGAQPGRINDGGAQPGEINGAGGRLGRIAGDGSQSRRMTGPRTAHGKRRSSRNAVKHGIFSKVATIKGESRAEFDAFLKGLHESLRPVGALEHLLVEKLALLAWRYRRMVIAEGAEIQKSVDFFEWDRDLNREHAIDSSLPTAKFAGGLIARFRSPEMIDRCIELLEELRSTVARLGFDLERDRNLLATLYGTDVESPSRHSLLLSYGRAAMSAERVRESDAEDANDNGSSLRMAAAECDDVFLREVEEQIRWLRGCRKQFGAVEGDRTQLELLTRQIPDAAKSDRLLRYEAALERGFDRALGQLERLQRMRLGLATLPPLRLELSG